ncbi:TPA: hypothetical protein ACH3X1_009671 [Trebouxia sp. C0004]
MEEECQQTLMVTNADLRKATCKSITGISFPETQSSRNADCLLRGSWPLLQTLDLSNSNMDKGVVSQLSKGPWPLLTSLSSPVGLKSGLYTQPNIFSHFNGKFPSLKRLTSCEHKLDRDGVTAMTAIDWPSFTKLSIDRWVNGQAVM